MNQVGDSIQIASSCRREPEMEWKKLEVQYYSELGDPSLDTGCCLLQLGRYQYKVLSRTYQNPKDTFSKRSKHFERSNANRH